MPCDSGYVHWINDYFGECIYTPKEEAGFFFGLSSTLIWMYAQLPQITINCKNKRADSLSFAFLCLLVLGDTCNLVGAIIAHGLVTQMITATWFIMVDVFCTLQFVWYVWIRKYFYADDPHNKDLTPDEQLGSNPSLNVIPMLAVAGSALLLQKTKETTPGPYEVPNLYGTLLGWASACSYISSRTPQIVKNCRRRKTDGLSIQFFISAILGNTTYGISIFLKDHHWPYIWRQFPWLVGSLGILFFDFTILWQFLTFGAIEEKDESYNELISQAY